MTSRQVGYLFMFVVGILVVLGLLTALLGVEESGESEAGELLIEPVVMPPGVQVWRFCSGLISGDLPVDLVSVVRQIDPNDLERDRSYSVQVVELVKAWPDKTVSDAEAIGEMLEVCQSWRRYDAQRFSR